MVVFLIPADTERPIVKSRIGDNVSVLCPIMRDLQELVGGYIQTVPLPESTEVVLVVDEDGKLKSTAKPNVRASRLSNSAIVGNAVLVGMVDGEFRDVPSHLRPKELVESEYTTLAELMNLIEPADTPAQRN